MPTPPVLILDAAPGRAEIPGLCARLGTLLRGSDTGEVICDVAALRVADMAAVEVLARLHLTAQRLGGQVRLRHASPPLRALLTLSGLCAEVGLPEVRGQPEHREEPVGVEERVEPDDPPT